MDQHHVGQDNTVSNLAEVFVQGAARVFELQNAAARALLETQGRTAAMLGAPDWTRALPRSEEAKALFDTGAQQVIDYWRESNRALADAQNQFVQLWQQQTRQMTEQARQTMEEFGRRGREGMEEWRRSAQQSAHHAQRFAQDVAQQSAHETQDNAAQSAPSLVVPVGESIASEVREERSRSRRNA